MKEIINKVINFYRPYFKYRNWIKFAIYSLVLVLLILFDVFSKIGIYNSFSDNSGNLISGWRFSYREVFFGLITIRLSFNTGAAFSAFSSAPEFSKIFLSLLSLIMFIVLMYFYVVYFDYIPNIFLLCLVLLSSGCFGNMVDRFGRIAENKYYKDGVIDFIDITKIFPSFQAIFNIADVCVVAAFTTGIIAAIYYLIIYILERKNK